MVFHPLGDLRVARPAVIRDLVSPNMDERLWREHLLDLLVEVAENLIGQVEGGIEGASVSLVAISIVALGKDTE
tara:strand:- start:560 stop:781 length:222 start_codon:yes stop_codon:yes gene_type:complete